MPFAKSSEKEIDMRLNNRPVRRHFRVLVLALSLMIPASVFGAAQTPIAGHWEGSIQAPGNPISISVDFSQKADGAIGASISIPAQGAKDMPLSNVAVTGSDVSFDLPGVPGEPKFKGKVEEGGGKITGSFTQSGATLTFTLERKAAPAAGAKKAPARFGDTVTDATKP